MTATISIPARDDRPRRSRQTVFKLATAGIMCVAMLGFSELALRIVAPQPASWFDVYRRHPSLPFHALLPLLDELVDTGETRWRLFTDHDGFRVSRKAVGAKRTQLAPRWALVLGDSFSFGTGVNYHDGFVDRLDRLSPLRFTNASVPGYGPVQYRKLMELALQRGAPPRLVLASLFLGNDFHDCIWEKDVPVRDGVVGDAGDLKSIVKRYSHLYRLLSKVYHVLVPQPAEGVGAPKETFEAAAWAKNAELKRAVAILDQELKTMAELSRRRGVPLLWVVIPVRESIAALRGEGPSDGRDYQLPMVHVTKQLQALGVPFLDITGVLSTHPTDEVYFPYDGHLTPLGNRLVGDALLPKIAALAPAP